MKQLLVALISVLIGISIGWYFGYTRPVIKEYHQLKDALNLSNMSPKQIVPDADTAIKIAVVVLSRIYGEREIAAQNPYRATLQHGIWSVQGSQKAVGHVAYAQIVKADARVLLTGMAIIQSNQPMKPTSPSQGNLNELATPPCRGLSPSR
jgi:hypothetical protein